MKNRTIGLVSAAVFASFAAMVAYGATVDETSPLAFAKKNSTILTDSVSVTGGTLYRTILRQAGPDGAVVGVTSSFAPVAATSPLRYLPLTLAMTNAGVGLTASAGSGSLGISLTGGNLQLTGEATSGDAKTNAGNWEFVLPDTYVAAAALPLRVNAVVTGAGTLTGASTTITPTAFLVGADGAETELAVTPTAAEFDKTAATELFSIAGATLTPGARIVMKLSVLVTSASGANTGWIRSVALQM